MVDVVSNSNTLTKVAVNAQIMESSLESCTLLQHVLAFTRNLHNAPGRMEPKEADELRPNTCQSNGAGTNCVVIPGR
jgi:hypothetical protein